MQPIDLGEGYISYKDALDRPCGVYALSCKVWPNIVVYTHEGDNARTRLVIAIPIASFISHSTTITT